jgi:hypothetical protein
MLYNTYLNCSIIQRGISMRDTVPDITVKEISMYEVTVPGIIIKRQRVIAPGFFVGERR